MNEAEFAYRIRQALDEGVERLDYTVSLRLQKARLAAIERGVLRQSAPVWVPALQLASEDESQSVDTQSRVSAWLLRFGLAVPLIALALGIVGIKQWQNDQMVAEVADIDFAVLLDDTPIDTYAHQGYGVYLRNENGM
ncbi:conserved hypothetical protein [Burkholderiales bacterium]|jgi:hypothetical protein|nr:conserved hypothetical protein [Burkholderiales bacterium]